MNYLHDAYRLNRQQGSAILVAMFLVVLVSATTVLFAAQAKALAVHTLKVFRQSALRSAYSGAEAWALAELSQPQLSSKPKAWQVTLPRGQGRVGARLTATGPQFFSLCVDIERNSIHQYWRTTLQRQPGLQQQWVTRVIQQQFNKEPLCPAN